MTRRAIIGSLAVLLWVSMPVAVIAAEDVEAELEWIARRYLGPDFHFETG